MGIKNQSNNPLQDGEIAYIFIKVFELEKMTRFYCERLGFNVYFAQENECAFLQLRGDKQVRVALYPGRTVPISTEEPYWFFVINVRNLDLILEKLKEENVDIRRIENVPNGRVVLIRDLENNQIEIHEFLSG